MLKDGKIWIGTGVNGPVYLLPSMANRHGLIAGATGTGKTVTLKVLAESFSAMGVPVFLSDIKSDLSGMVKPGDRTAAIEKRLGKCDVPAEDFEFRAFPSTFWDVYGKNGKPIQATVRGMGAQLMSRMLGLNETQTGVLNILYRYTKEYNYDLLTLEDLKYQLGRMGENTQSFTLHYGNVSVASVGAIQRAVAMLEDEGGSKFFGREDFNIQEWLKRDESNSGMINILSADELFAHPRMYSTFLMWMLTRLYEFLPERGDSKEPVAVFFFDEAHLLFDDCSKALMEKIEKVVRLIRSKGVGVYFITQSPADIPMAVLGQLGNRVQHALRAYTPMDQRAVKVAAQTFRANPDFSTEEAITGLKTGEALISCLDEDGAPGVVQRATILPPQSHLGALTEAERALAVKGLPLEPEEAPAETETAAATTEPEIPETTPAFPEAITPPDADAIAEAYFAPEAPDEPGEPPVMEIPETETPAPEIPTLEIPKEPAPFTDILQAVPQIQFPVSPTTPEPVQETTGQEEMSQTFKVFDPVTGQYVEQTKPDMTPVQPAAAPQAEPAPEVPVIQVMPETPAPQPVVPQPVFQQMPVMVLDQASGQYVQQMMWMQLDPATGNYIPVQPAVQPQVVTDPKVLAEQQKAAEKAARDAAREAREQEAAERRARTDALREEAAERARRNDSVVGRVKNTAINTATRQVVSSLTKGLTKAVGDLIGGNNKK